MGTVEALFPWETRAGSVFLKQFSLSLCVCVLVSFPRFPSFYLLKFLETERNEEPMCVAQAWKHLASIIVWRTGMYDDSDENRPLISFALDSV